MTWLAWFYLAVAVAALVLALSAWRLCDEWRDLFWEMDAMFHEAMDRNAQLVEQLKGRDR